MTRDDIIRMAREAGAGNLHGGEWALFGDASIERFFHMAYAAGAAAEREACAQVCEQIDVDSFGKDRPAPNDCSAAIRARSNT